MSCYDAGATYLRSMPLNVVTCNATSPKNPSIGDLGRYLISEGKAAEVCAETFGYYETCN